jgi:hypothetical protein
LVNGKASGILAGDGFLVNTSSIILLPEELDQDEILEILLPLHVSSKIRHKPGN